jgi:hypothetical protein
MRGIPSAAALAIASRVALAIASAVALVGCAGPDGISSAVPGGIVVTFEVNEGERFRVLLTDPADQAIAARLLAGAEGPDIPNGRIVRATGVNEGWSWSLDPADFEFGDLTAEVCDGAPSDVESGALTSDRYCPWSARIVEIEPAS